MLDQLSGNKPEPKRVDRFKMSVEDRAGLELNDRGNAKRLLAAHGADVIFVLGKGWGVWDGNRYSLQSGPLKAAEMAASLPDLIEAEIKAMREKEYTEFELSARMKREADKPKGKRYVDLADVAQDMRQEVISKLYAHQIKCGNVDKQVKALKAMEWQVRAEIRELDADPWQFVVKNGVVDLKAVSDCEAPAGQFDFPKPDLAQWRAPWLIGADRAPLPTKRAGTNFIPGATCPQWDEFMELILPDSEVRHCLQRALGALLFGMNVAQVALLIRGSGGNGKSTLMQIIGEVLGTFDGYAAPVKVEMFLQTQNQSAGQATPEEVDLPGARAMLASEPAVTDIFSAKKIKSLTGGDLRPARALGMPQFVYRPTAIPIILFNRTPRIKDEDEGTRRRLVFIPLDVNLRELPPEQRRNPLDVERALKEELPGILNWMLDGFRDFYVRLEAGKGTPPGIDPPGVMQTLKDRIMEAADPVGTFIRECAIVEDKGRTRTADFFRAFKNWARDNGARVYSDAALRDNLTEKGVQQSEVKRQYVFCRFHIHGRPTGPEIPRGHAAKWRLSRRQF